ncbi:hypothetical protein pb186bvf_001091 [Paramecium bursaria]
MNLEENETNYLEEDEKCQVIENDPSCRFSKVLNIKISTYQYNEEIGKGAYKRVYRGYDKESGCEIAWNVFELERVPENDRKRVHQEIKILKSLKHDNIINFIHSWHNYHKKEIVFITEIVNGGSLKNYQRRITRPKLKVIKHWCREILNGLVYLHSKNIIHRDLKCENILIDTNTNVLKIGDFGLSIQLNTLFTGSVLGTPEFMAPEIYNEHYDTKVDIYAFGMCILEMVTGMKPFCECKGGTGQIIKKVLESQKPQSIEAILNDKIKSIILDCLKPSQERPTAQQLLQQFQATNSEEDNLQVLINEQYLLQLKGESKNSSFLSFKMNQTKMSSMLSGLDSQTRNKIEQRSMHKKPLSIETEDMESIEFNFLKQYSKYLLTQNDETINDLEARQEKELQIMMALHKAQRQTLLNKNIQAQLPKKITSPVSTDIQQLNQPIAESPNSEDENPKAKQILLHKSCSVNQTKLDVIQKSDNHFTD